MSATYTVTLSHEQLESLRVVLRARTIGQGDPSLRDLEFALLYAEPDQGPTRTTVYVAMVGQDGLGADTKRIRVFASHDAASQYGHREREKRGGWSAVTETVVEE